MTDAAKKRLAELKEKVGKTTFPQGRDVFVNNHIHTTYSFSPYSPCDAAYNAKMAGLVTAGIMDHDSVGGCEEFVEAGKIIGIATTCGFECRVSMAGTPFESIRTNNPDQVGVSYVALHGIPAKHIGTVEKFLAPYREKRNLRNRKMTEKINEICAPYGISLDFDKDIAAISQTNEGGSITERHILFALSNKIINRFGKGKNVVDFLENEMKINLSDKIKDMLTDGENPHYAYDLLGALKSDMVSKFYIPATDECPHITEFVKLAKEVNGFSAYAYLGDVTASVTGDKKAQKFEDEYLDDLFKFIKEVGFTAVTYMPSRNTKEQLNRIMALCKEYGFFQISGEDINTPRQSFICKQLEEPMFAHLIDATWKLIEHEKQFS